MTTNARVGVVIFATDHRRLADFYAAVTDLPVRFVDDTIVVLHSDTFELVIHKLPGEPVVSNPPAPRLDSYIKPFFPVAELASARERAITFGGQLKPADKEWGARGFRASEGIDPEGNIIQFREDAP
jgi:predicted enzyme related to lactoylglutathione lyase